MTNDGSSSHDDNHFLISLDFPGLLWTFDLGNPQKIIDDIKYIYKPLQARQGENHGPVASH